MSKIQWLGEESYGWKSYCLNYITVFKAANLNTVSCVNKNTHLFLQKMTGFLYIMAYCLGFSEPPFTQTFHSVRFVTQPANVRETTPPKQPAIRCRIPSVLVQESFGEK